MIEIIPMERQHIKEVYAIELECFADPWSEDSLYKEIMENKLAVYFVARDIESGKLAGFAGLWHIINEGHITNVAVLPEFRGEGIGQRLVQTLIDYGLQHEMINLTLEVRVHNERAQGLYRKMGFKMIGLRKNYYSDTKEDAIIMLLDLEA